MTKNAYTKDLTGGSILVIAIMALGVLFGVLALITWLLQTGLTGAGVDINYWDTMALAGSAYLLLGLQGVRTK